MSEEILLWCDLETTGLDEKKGHVLEAGFQLTSLYMDRTWWSFSSAIHFPEAKWKSLDTYIKTMHTGLLLDCRDSSMTVGEVEALVLGLLAQEMTGPGVKAGGPKLKLAGSSVHFDRDWLRVHMPNLARILHYQLLDVSAFYPVLKRKGLYPETERAHRVRDDLVFSQECYRRILEITK